MEIIMKIWQKFVEWKSLQNFWRNLSSPAGETLRNIYHLEIHSDSDDQA